MRFDLIDQVVEQDAARIAAVKNVSSAEEYLADHFPGFPILPGVMMLEVLVQAARKLAAGRDDRPARPLVVAEVRNVKYAAMVKPGQALHVEVSLAGRDDGRWKFVGRGTVEGRTAVQAKLVLREVGHGM